MADDLARYDRPIWRWAQSDTRASRGFKRVLKKRFCFAAWKFSDAGFSKNQAEIRGRMMLIFMMGESTLIPESVAKRKEFIKLKHAILTAPEQWQAKKDDSFPCGQEGISRRKNIRVTNYLQRNVEANATGTN